MNDLQKIMAQLARIEDHLRHLRYGEGQAYATHASAANIVAYAAYPAAPKPAPAQSADPQSQRTDRA